jgi:hypothetical protein
MNQTNEKKISKDEYKRPKYTIQDKLTEEEIEEKLADYIEIENINKVPIGSHIRYYTLVPNKNGELIKTFRLGGQLKNKDNSDKFIILSNGKVTWSVQMDTSILYRKMTIDEIKEDYENIIKELEDSNLQLKKDNKKLLKKIIELEKKK